MNLEESGHGLIEVLSQYVPRGTQERQKKKPSQVSQRPGQDLNRTPTKGKSSVCYL
jgi:hypothetical protein